MNTKGSEEIEINKSELMVLKILKKYPDGLNISKLDAEYMAWHHVTPVVHSLKMKELVTVRIGVDPESRFNRVSKKIKLAEGVDLSGL